MEADSDIGKTIDTPAYPENIAKRKAAKLLRFQYKTSVQDFPLIEVGLFHKIIYDYKTTSALCNVNNDFREYCNRKNIWGKLIKMDLGMAVNQEIATENLYVELFLDQEYNKLSDDNKHKIKDIFFNVIGDNVYGFNLLINKYKIRLTVHVITKNIIPKNCTNILIMLINKKIFDVNKHIIGKPPLFYAVLNDKIKIAKILLKNGGDKTINDHNKDEKSSLLVACEKCNYKMIKLLIRNGADPTIIEQKNTYIIHVIKSECKFDNKLLVLKQIIRYLFNNGTKLDGAVHAVIDSKHDDIDTRFYNIGLNINIKIDLIDFLLNLGADINEMYNYNTPITLAITYGNIYMIKKLLDYGADINKPKLGLNYIHSLDKINNNEIIEKIKFIIENTDLNSIDNSSIDSIVKKLVEYDVEIAPGKSILFYFSDFIPNIKDTIDYDTLLHLACFRNNYTAVKFLIKYIDVNMLNKYNDNPLQKLTSSVYLKPSYIIDKNTREIYEKQCIDNFLNITKLLIKAGIDINHKNKQNNTALTGYITSFSNRQYFGDYLSDKIISPLVSLYLDNGYDVNNIVSKNKNNLLLHVLNNIQYKIDVDVITRIIDMTNDINYSNKDGVTTLMLVRELDLFKLLLNKGADIFTTDKNNKTVLIHHAENYDIVKYIIEYIPNYTEYELTEYINHKDDYENTALYYAIYDEDIRELLVENGAFGDIQELKDKYYDDHTPDYDPY